MRLLVAVAVLALVACSRRGLQPPAAAVPAIAPAAGEEWSVNRHDLAGTGYSPLADITRENVSRLAVAWTASTGEASLPPAEQERFALEATPIVVDGTMYVSTPLGRVLALDPETGTRRWTFDPKLDQRLRFGDFTNRGVATWLDPDAPAGARCRRTIYVATLDARLIALDARTGAPCARFGRGGTVNLREGLRNPPQSDTEYEQTSPPTVVNGIVVVGSAIADNGRTDMASGEVRGFDARTGVRRWTWDPVPQDSSDRAWFTWRGPQAHRTGGANAWSLMAADPERDLVFLPTASPSPDYYGGERIGDNRYANSIVALHASTGQLVWHFQTVHHDLWDYDNASPPALITLRREGQELPAVVQATKTGQLFVLHRETGAPIVQVQERSVPPSDVPGEMASPTQPFSGLSPLSPHVISADDAWGPTADDRESCRARIAALRNEGIFTPPSLRGTFVVPSNVGGAHWGGVAFDPERQVIIAPVNRIAAEVQLLSRADFDSARARMQRGERLEGDWEYAAMRGTPYAIRRRIMVGPSGLPCTPPPFGALVGVSLRTGLRVWGVPLGDVRGMLPPGTTMPLPAGTGAPNLGGPVITAGGVVFIAATADRSLRAFDVETGRELWRGELPAGARTTPAVYRARAGGKQYVVVTAGGGDIWGKGDAIVAFALP